MPLSAEPKRSNVFMSFSTVGLARGTYLNSTTPMTCRELQITKSGDLFVESPKRIVGSTKSRLITLLALNSSRRAMQK